MPENGGVSARIGVCKTRRRLVPKRSLECRRMQRVMACRSAMWTAKRPCAGADKAPRRPKVVARTAGGANHELSMDVLSTWRRATAVCFDMDCTCSEDDSLDGLAEFAGKGEEVKKITDMAMNGEMGLEEALVKRLQIINPTPQMIKDFLIARPPESRLTPGIKELVNNLQNRGISVYIISGGFRPLALPFAKLLNIPPENVYANRIYFTTDDETGMPTVYAGYDKEQPTAKQGGKPEAIKALRSKHPLEDVVMIGDGITDLEAARMPGGADLFIGYGGVVERKEVRESADFYITDFSVLTKTLTNHQVAFVGSGAWACSAANLVAKNCMAREDFESNVRMWVYEEEVDGRMLTEIINEDHENVKYLPGIKLEKNIVAYPDLDDVINEADIIVFCVPHQFVHRICKQMVGKIRQDAVAISLTKGMRLRSDGAQLISDMIRRKLGIDCSVLMGANIAEEIGKGELSEATIGYKWPENARLFQEMFQSDSFLVETVQDVEGAELCGTLKNVVALATGIVKGLGYGSNTKAAIMRAGMSEMRRLAKRLYYTVQDETFFMSCGLADLIATCEGGRNQRVAKAFAEMNGEKTLGQLEEEMLKGQKLQGELTSDEVQAVLRAKGWENDFPLFTTVNRIIHGQLPIQFITQYQHIAGFEAVEPSSDEVESAIEDAFTVLKV